MSNRLFNLKFIAVVSVSAPVRRPTVYNYSSFEFKVVFQPGSSLDGTLVRCIEAMDIKQHRIFLHWRPHLISSLNKNENIACHDLIRWLIRFDSKLTVNCNNNLHQRDQCNSEKCGSNQNVFESMLAP